MSSVRSQILDAILAALNGTGTPAPAERFRTTNVEMADLPRILVHPATEDIQKVSPNPRSPLMERRVVFKLDLLATFTGTTSPDQAIDPLLVWVTSQIFKDPGFGARAIETQETRLEWDAETVDSGLAKCTVEISVRYHTKTTDQTVKA